MSETFQTVCKECGHANETDTGVCHMCYAVFGGPNYQSPSSSGAIHSDDDPRFWWIEADPAIGHPEGKYGLVDEEAGGITAWFDTYDEVFDAVFELNAHQTDGS